MAQESNYRVILQARRRPQRGYAFVIVRTDLPEWAEHSRTLYATIEAASEAAWTALERSAYGTLRTSVWPRRFVRERASSGGNEPTASVVGSDVTFSQD
jgi:hypothetical protein